jgi:hypothetical protein
MFVLLCLTWVTYGFGICFGLLCFAQGLYYIADLVEEHGQFAKRALRWLLLFILGVHVLLLLFEPDAPFLQCAAGIVAHCAYLLLLPEFPYVRLSSPVAVVSGVLALANHFLWFAHMLGYAVYGYAEIIAIFVVCVWLAPLAFIVSLSTTEPLPYGASPDSVSARRKGTNRIASMFRFLKAKQDELLPRSVPKTL